MIISAKTSTQKLFLTWLFLLVIGLTLVSGLSAASYNVSTIAGSAVSFSGDGATATAARLNNPFGVFVHSSGDTYFADTANNRIRKITASTGFISTIAGTGTASFSGDGTPATAATLNAPNGIYVNSDGDVYIADTGNQRIRKIVGGIISTIAGSNSTAGFADGAATTTARFSSPYGVFVDSGGNTYIADRGNHRVRKLMGTTVSTIAGTGTANFTGDNAAATAATLSSPYGVCVDSSNNVYIADTANNRIRMIAGSAASIFGSARTVGRIYTIAGGSVTAAGFAGDGASATATGVRFNSPYSVCLDSTGNVYIADGVNNRIRMLINTAGTYFGSSRTANFIYTIAGTGASSFLDGAAATAQLSNPQGVCVDSTGNIYIAESGNDRLRKLAGTTVSTIAGGNIGDGGVAAAASLNGLLGICRDNSGNIYFSDTANNRIRKITADGIISTVAGTGASGSTGDGAAATAALLNAPSGICADNRGNIYFSDVSNRRIRMLVNTTGTYFGIARTAGNIYTIAGTGSSGSSGDNAIATSALLNAPCGTCVDSSGNIYFADSSNNSIRKITATNGFISKIAGTGASGSSGDGGAATTATFNNPWGIFWHSSGNLYVTDYGNDKIRKFTVGGTISTVAGTGTQGFSGDGGAATAAMLANPRGIYVDSSSNIYFSDQTNNRIRKFTVGGNISTIAGGSVTTAGYAGDGGSATAAAVRFNAPYGICGDSTGKVYVADSTNNVIRKLAFPSATYSGSQTLPSAVTGTAYISGGGTAILPSSNTYNEIEIGSGTLQVSSSAPITFNASSGSAIVEILAAINTGAFTFNTPGAVKIATGIAAILDAPSGSSLMSKTGAGRLRAVDNLSSSTTPVAVSEGILEVSGSGKLPNAATSVASGATLQLGTASGSVVAGAVANASVASGGIMSILAGATGAVTSADIASGGIVSVEAGVTVPEGMFSSLTFNSGGIVQLGAGATFSQSITMVA